MFFVISRRGGLNENIVEVSCNIPENGHDICMHLNIYKDKESTYLSVQCEIKITKDFLIKFDLKDSHNISQGIYLPS